MAATSMAATGMAATGMAATMAAATVATTAVTGPGARLAGREHQDRNQGGPPRGNQGFRADCHIASSTP